MGRRIFALIVVGLFLYISAPLLTPVLMGAILAVLFFPMLEAMERKKLSTNLASSFLTIGVTLVVLMPAAFLIFLGAKAGLQQVRVWQTASRDEEATFFHSLVHSPAVQTFLEKISDRFPVNVQELVSTAEDLARQAGFWLADVLGNLFGQVPGMAMGLSITVFSIYFFLVDGRKAVHFVRRNSVFNAEQTEELIRSVAGMCRSVVLASVLSGFIQSLLIALSCIAAGVGNAPLIGLVVFLGSFIPLVGASPITFSIAIYQLLVGNRSAGVFLIVMAIVAGLVDNVIRPVVLRGAGNLHPLMGFIAAFGGLQALGFSGVFLGPIIAGLFVSTAQHLLQDDERTL